MFRSKAVAAVVLTCAVPALRPGAEQRSRPPPPLMPIALEGNADRGEVLARDLQGLPRHSRAISTRIRPITCRSSAARTPTTSRSRCRAIAAARAATTRCRRKRRRCRIRTSPTSRRSSPAFEGEAETGRTTRVGGADRSRPREGRDLRRVPRARRRRGRAAMAESRGPARDLPARSARPVQGRQPRRPGHEPADGAARRDRASKSSRRSSRRSRTCTTPSPSSSAPTRRAAAREAYCRVCRPPSPAVSSAELRRRLAAIGLPRAGGAERGARGVRRAAAEVEQGLQPDGRARRRRDRRPPPRRELRAAPAAARHARSPTSAAAAACPACRSRSSSPSAGSR